MDGRLRGGRTGRAERVNRAASLPCLISEESEAALMLPRLLACGLVLLLLPVAGAFPTSAAEVSIRYPAGAAPVAVGVGTLSFEGVARGGVLGAGDADFASFHAVPSFDILYREADGKVRPSALRDVTLVIHEGSFLWRFDSGAFRANASPEYGLGLALPQVPVSAAAGPGILLAGDSLRAAGRWSGEVSQLVALDASVSLFDRDGEALPGWERRVVNRDVSVSEADPATVETLFVVSGAFSARIDRGVVGFAFGDSPEAALRVRPAERDRFSETLTLLEEAGAQLGIEEGPLSGSNPLRALADLSPILNGATLLVPSGGDAGATPPTSSVVGGRDFPVGPITVLRSDDLQVGWRDDEMQVQGDATVAVGREGFAVEAPVALGFMPLAGIILWALAAVAIVWFLIRRPPAAKGSWTYRILGWAAHLAAFLLVFYLWDSSFRDTFGTSFLALASEGITPESVPRLMLVLALEMVPWGLAALLFALPVRIALGVGLRYLGQGKSFKGIAKAGGLLSLAIFGPLHALWLFNVVLEHALPFLPTP